MRGLTITYGYTGWRSVAIDEEFSYGMVSASVYDIISIRAFI